jgi:hypothetical protein
MFRPALFIIRGSPTLWGNTLHILHMYYTYCRAYGNYIRRGLDCQLDLLDHNIDTLTYSAQTLQLTTVDHNARLATAPQPVLHCNQLLWLPLPTLTLQPSSAAASKQAVAYCWHSPAWLFLV